MGRHLILRGVDRRLIRRLRDRAAALGIDTGAVARAVLIEQLTQPDSLTRKGKRRKAFKA